MGYLPDDGLQVWGKGDQLTADGLNNNFATLREYAERALDRAMRPDPAVVALEMRMGRIEARLDLVESMLAMHARQRNEREWAPLSHLGGVLIRVDGLQRDVEAAVARLEAMFATITGIHDDQSARLARLEQQPEAAPLEAFEELVAEHQGTAQKAQATAGEASELRQMLTYVRRIAEGHDRIANRREYAPLATVGHLFERLQKLEERL